jgi:ribosomal protein S3
LSQKLDIKVSLSFLENSMATSSLMTRYIVRKLRYRYTLGELIGYIKNNISGQVKGLRLKCSGRFTRRQRASIKKASFGRISLNTMGYFIDYNYSPVTLKYGVGGIKI